MKPDKTALSWHPIGISANRKMWPMAFFTWPPMNQNSSPVSGSLSMVVGLRAKGLSINNVHILARAPGVLGPRASRPLNCPIIETSTFIPRL